MLTHVLWWVRLRNTDSCFVISKIEECWFMFCDGMLTHALSVFRESTRTMRSVGTPWPASGWRTTPTRSCGATTSTTGETSVSSPSTTEWYVTLNVKVHSHWSKTAVIANVANRFDTHFSEGTFTFVQCYRTVVKSTSFTPGSQFFKCADIKSI